ncbi:MULTISPECIES: WXG100 family type VII secretion target [unclassified Agrococcus]|uniref:WXG100 family type VII secretion target n=1 Tax=unclassified Agrococcus TaxID=2615065 RepID=UPI00361476A3
MTRYVVDSDAIDAARAAAHATVGRIQTDCAALHGQLQALQDSWSGGASAAFQGCATDWRATQQRVEESLRQITIALQTASQQYTDVESANMRLFAV